MSAVRTRSGLVLGLVVVLLLATAASAAVKPGKYVGTTSEKGTVSFTVSPGGKTVTHFTAQDGYNGKCKFHGGVGGLGNFTMAVPSMKVTPGGRFSATRKVKLGPFSATIALKGKLTATGATGTLNKVGAGALCGTGAANPKQPLYLETFTAKPV